LPEAPARTPSTAQELAANPASHDSLMVLSALSYAENRSDAGAVAYDAHGPNITWQPSRHPNEASEAYPHRSELIDMQIEDPRHMQWNRLIPFQMIAHHSDPESALNIFAAYQPDSHTLIVVASGFDWKLPDAMSLEATLAGRENPEDQAVASFAADLKESLRAKDFPIRHTVLYGHSLGAGPTVTLLGESMRDPELEALLGGAPPKTVLVEEWKSWDALQRVAQEEHLATQELRRHVTSVVSIPATLARRGDNPTVGEKTAVIVPTGDLPDMGERQARHTMRGIFEGLYENRISVVEPVQEIHPHSTRLAHLIVDVAEMQSNRSMEVAETAAMAGGAAAGFLASVLNARRQEKDREL
jgi:hypothetical protein